jgi:alpha-glucuronidase
VLVAALTNVKLEESVWKSAYNCWLQYSDIKDHSRVQEYKKVCSNLVILDQSAIIDSAKEELEKGLFSMLGETPTISYEPQKKASIVLATYDQRTIKEYGVDYEDCNILNDDGYMIQSFDYQGDKAVLLLGKTDKGILYAAFHLLRLIQMSKDINNLTIFENPKNQIRMINHWDNMLGDIERGYSGNSIFYDQNEFTHDVDRIKDYARYLSSVGINSLSINNVNVHQVESKLITKELLPHVAEIADIFRSYGINTYLSVNYASPIEIGDLNTADPLDSEVQAWWSEKVAEIYEYIPDFGGFIVKADSEHRPGPFTYGRNHADGANLLGRALEPFGGIVFWRCFVYDCLQDWRDRKTDRAKAAYDHFKQLDGEFLDNVILQIKNGPMDFQVREPVSPLFGSLKQTNQVLEFQVAQEYTGQQKDLCFLVPQWKEVLDFDTYSEGKGSTVKSIVNGSKYPFQYSGITAVSNIGNDLNWTGNTLAQANFYGYGRLIWDTELSAEEISDEWVRLTFGHDEQVVEEVNQMLLNSWQIYENYTSPLGVGWMINPGHHYGPNIEGYEYSKWGTYHFSDCLGTGVNRTVKNGTGYSGQYYPENAEIYESLETCPDELLLFFHHVPYTHRLKSGETVIQHIYNTHFLGVEQVENMKARWEQLKDKIDTYRYENVLDRFTMQLENAIEWRDRINTYFYRHSGIPDEKKRTIY